MPVIYQPVGETADRIQYSNQFDSVFLLGAIEVRDRGLSSLADESVARQVSTTKMNGFKVGSTTYMQINVQRIPVLINSQSMVFSEQIWVL